MEYRRIGNCGAKVSVIGLGSWLTLGGSVEKKTGKELIYKAYDNGVIFYDTADIYAYGESEKFYGEVLSAFKRSDLFIATKCYFPITDNPNDRGLSRKHITESTEKSLKNLKTDYIDLFQCHRFDENTPVEETCRAFNTLIEQGKILYWGISEWKKLQIETVFEICEKYNLHKPISNQPNYSLLARNIETNGVLEICERYGIGQLVFSPLAQGVLTGKYNKNRKYPSSRLNDKRYNFFMRHIATEENFKRVDELIKISDELGLTPSAVAIAWCLRKEIISSVITSATKTEQMEENLKASGVVLNIDVIKKLDTVFNK
jgi:voltage-dependent potassium channel beta subunit